MERKDKSAMLIDFESSTLTTSYAYSLLTTLTGIDRIPHDSDGIAELEWRISGLRQQEIG